MDTRQLAAFCAIVERKSFSEAAERLGVTQPAVSQQIRSLEERLGQQLLDRSGRRVEPTEAGLRLYRGAQRLLAQERQLLEDVAGEAEGRCAGSSRWAPRRARAGRSSRCSSASSQRRTRTSRSTLTISDTQTIVDRVARRELELGVVGATRRNRSVAYEPFFRDEVVLACPPEHRFAGKTITLDDLRGEPLIVMQEGAGVRQVIEDELRARGTRLRDLDVRLELGLQESVKSAVEAGHGVTFISRTAVEPELEAGTLAAAPRRGPRALARDLARPRGGPRLDPRGRRVRRVRAGTPCDRPLGPRGAAGRSSPSSASSGRSSSPARGGKLPVEAAATLDGGAVAPHRGRGRGGERDGRHPRARRRQRDRPREGDLGRDGPPARLRPDHLLRGGVDAELRDPRPRRSVMRGGGSGANLAGIVYEPKLTLDLPRAETVGTSLNALAHCGRGPVRAGAATTRATGSSRRRRAHRRSGCRRSSRTAGRPRSAPRAPGAARCTQARPSLLAGLGLGACDGPGARRALRASARGDERTRACRRRCASTSRWPEPRSPASARRWATDDPVGRVEELARLGGFERLRDFGVPEEELDEVAAAARGPCRRAGESPPRIPGRDRRAAALGLVIRDLRQRGIASGSLQCQRDTCRLLSYMEVEPQMAIQVTTIKTLELGATWDDRGVS